MMDSDRRLLLSLSESLKIQMDTLAVMMRTQDELRARIKAEEAVRNDRFLSLAEVKKVYPDVDTHRLNALTRSGTLKVRKLSSRKTEYSLMSLKAAFPDAFRNVL